MKSMERVEQADKLVMESITMVKMKEFTNLSESHAQILVSLLYNQLEDQWREFASSNLEELKILHSQLACKSKSEMNIQFLKNYCQDGILLSGFNKNRLNYDKIPVIMKLFIEEKVQELRVANSSYFGGVNNNWKWGQGILIDNNNKQIQEGVWKNNQMIWGQTMKKTNYSCYSLSIGQFHNGQLDSKGLILYSNGDNYDCKFRNSEIEAQGEFQYSNGDNYEGSFIQDKKQGKGVYMYKNGDYYNGYYKNDKRDGLGKYLYSNGDSYEGQYIQDKKEGKGIFKYFNGDIYDGEYKNDKKEGKGVFKYFNGDIYDGEYKNDKKEGKGIFQYSNHEYFKGCFINDKREGSGYYITANSEILQQTYLNDKQVPKQKK